MKRLNVLLAAALLAGSATVSAIVIGPIANPEIYGQWQLTMSVNEGALNPGKGGDCDFIGPMELVMPSVIKSDADKISDPVTGEATMQLTGGSCGDFFAEISGSAFGDDIVFNMTVFPAAAVKGADKGTPPLIVLVFEGQLQDTTLMEGAITGAFLPLDKGASGVWRATRSTVVPAVTPAGILLLLAGLGLAGGIVLRRRR